VSNSDGTLLVAGIDVGTSSIKVAVMNVPSEGDATIRSKIVERLRRRDPMAVVKHCYGLALDAADARPESVDYVASTGEGHLVEFRRGHFFGMTAHARGASYLCPGAVGALDMGALHARAIRMDERSRVLGYCMTSQCASGTGQFVENIARYLGVTVSEVGPLSLQSNAPEKVSGICAVLAETDVINMVSRGIGTANILRGIHQSMADRLVKLLRSAKIAGPTVLTGGLATDVGLRAAIDEQLRNEARVKVTLETHPDAIFAGAIGAALWGAVRHRRLEERQRSRTNSEAQVVAMQ
jgi:benzoyl-CoA reductase subunit D